MANLTDLGGLFFQLGLVPDKNSFETGYRMIDGTVNKFSMLIGTARNAANTMIAFANDAGKADSALYKTSMRLGVTAEVLGTWKAAAKIAGVSADGLVSSMEELNYALHNQWGEGLDKYSKQLAKLGLGLDDLKDKEGNFLTGDKAVKKILEYTLTQYKAAGTNEEKLKIGYALSDALGESMFDLFTELIRSGMSVDELLAKAGKTQFQTPEGMEASQNFRMEWKTLEESLQSLSNYFGGELGKNLVGYVQGINEWLGNNGKDVQESLSKIAKGVGNTAGTAVTTVGAAAAIKKYLSAPEGSKEQQEAIMQLKKYREQFTNNPMTSWIVDLIDKRSDRKENEKQLKEEYNTILGYYNTLNKGKKQKQKLKYSELTPAQQYVVDDYKALGGEGSHISLSSILEMQDGIMRPDGTITKVAPDDWVFAARNLGDLARAFIPQNMTAANQGAMEFSIVQNFTINGGSDLPQVLRQQAYQGTQEGLMQIMAQSSRRLQLMSGTR